MGVLAQNMLKDFVGSNTEVTGRIPVSSQKDKAEKLYKLGKKKIKLHWRVQRSKTTPFWWELAEITVQLCFLSLWSLNLM